MKRIYTFVLTLCVIGFTGIQCTPESEYNPFPDGYGEGEDGLRPSTLLRKVEVHTDKSCYAPGEQVVFTADKNPKNYLVRYWHLGDVIHEEPLTSDTWTWTPPADDFKGYYVEIVGMDKENNERTMGSVAVDVSSDWTKFPRYGFLTKYGIISDSKMRSVVENLKDYHINAMQYYDWMNDHHKPLAGTADAPEDEWFNLINNMCYKTTVQGYIDLGHEYGIASMFYDLCYGVMEWANEDGVKEEWYAFNNNKHSSKDYHRLDGGFKSSIWIVDPNNEEWLDYFADNIDEMYEVFDFDGFHIDQLGNRGTKYTYGGKTIDMTAGFGKFINWMDKRNPEKKHTFNAVDRYGQSQIAKAKTDFLYNEVWTTGFTEIKTIIDENYRLAPEKNSVLAAYMNYKKSPKTGNFNTAAVLLMDAVTFSLGGSHLELGEHMLCSEYFPATNLGMDEELRAMLPCYYDFMTGYENLLRDGASYTDLTISSNDMRVKKYAPEQGAVNYFAKRKDNRTIIHLLNFTNATHLSWRDDAFTQAEPEEIIDASISLRAPENVTKVWVASPDVDGGVPMVVTPEKGAMSITIPVPYLKYWTMVVIETGE